MFIKIFELNDDISFPLFWGYCAEQFGTVYLQDQITPIISFSPKTLHLLDENKSFQRKPDFSYQEVDKPTTYIRFTDSSPNDTCLEFNGGYIFFISYDYAIKQSIHTPTSLSPSTLVGEYDLFFKLINDKWCLFVAKELIDSPTIEILIKDLESLYIDKKEQHTLCLTKKLAATWTKEKYISSFNKVQNYLYAGDCYQINLTQEFHTTIKSGQLSSSLPDLLNLTQAPFSGYLKFNDFELLSCSPELFIEFQSNQVIKTRPIKGTIPRHPTPSIDNQLKQQLSMSIKDQAENLMIVDLLRNDLSVYAETGSVNVPHLFEIESFAQVHHMVSEIQATLKPGTNPFDMLLSALPGGSITGAPKIRAMQIIEEIEGKSRGAYCGSLGYFNYDGTGRSNILIRTIQRYGDQLSVWAGGGITVASDVDAEYQECLDKVSALLNYLNQHVEKALSSIEEKS